ncbi:MAG: PQQ-binding-like beta-propeller repeat protein [Blastocatellia bacterium]
MANDAGVATCVDAKTGEKVWQARMDGIFSASPVAGDGKVYVMSETGETIVLKAGRELQVLARNNIDERIVASPAISSGRLSYERMVFFSVLERTLPAYRGDTPVSRGQVHRRSRSLSRFAEPKWSFASEHDQQPAAARATSRRRQPELD